MTNNTLKFEGNVEDFKTILSDLNLKIICEDEEEHGTQFRLIDATIHFYHKSPKHSIMVDGKKKEIIFNQIRDKFESLAKTSRTHPLYSTKDGHKVRSKSELIVDDWLYDHDLIHAYEKQIPESSIVPDFYLKNDNVYIEVFGDVDEKYLESKKAKEEYFKKNGIRVIEISNEDITNIDKAMQDHLKRFKITLNKK